MVQTPVTSSLRRCPVSSPTIKAGSISRRWTKTRESRFTTKALARAVSRFRKQTWARRPLASAPHTENRCPTTGPGNPTHNLPLKHRYNRHPCSRLLKLRSSPHKHHNRLSRLLPLSRCLLSSPYSRHRHNSCLPNNRRIASPARRHSRPKTPRAYRKRTTAPLIRLTWQSQPPAAAHNKARPKQHNRSPVKDSPNLQHRHRGLDKSPMPQTPPSPTAITL
ncbi:Uncharacterised protein [Mycobacteroides abscessus subsp. bolletii]|nr:Uncharacterised protein [Mycobacteroides abscessus subsp. bolletii]SKH26872.1 Uncharacterised protein [Mycobacteroides abscessus subsp. bolletii]SKH49851.1 Uncharacterised protein [Mycobacteroides abscessus subsp. bolletii]